MHLQRRCKSSRGIVWSKLGEAWRNLQISGDGACKSIKMRIQCGKFLRGGKGFRPDFWEGALDRILRKALGWILAGLKIYDDLRLDLRLEV